MKLAAPFPYFGGKARVAAHVWARFGDVQNYVEPFFGSGAVLLASPSPPKTETVNDLDGMVANFWRAVQAEPETVARYADWPVSELDLEARHRWLVGRKPELVQAVRTDPAYYEAKAAGWWVYGMSLWIGGDWCRKDVASSMTQVPYLKNGAMGVHSALRGVSTCAEATAIIHGRMAALADRLRRVRVEGQRRLRQPGHRQRRGQRQARADMVQPALPPARAKPAGLGVEWIWACLCSC